MKLKNIVALSVSGMSSAVFSVGAFAAPTTPVTDYSKQAFDSLSAQATSMSGYAWGLAVLIVGSTVGIKLFKKFVSRAS